MTTTTHTTLRRPVLAAFIRALPKVLAGKAPDPHGIAKGFRARVAFTWFSEVARSFDVKSKGGTDDAGDSWPPNSKEYLAYGKGPKSSRMGSGRSPSWPDHPGSGYLSVADRKVWWKIYGRNLGWLATRHDLGTAKRIAAQIAWTVWKDQGGLTLLGVYGNRPDTILVDGGTLRLTVLPGELTESGPSASYEKSDGDQVVQEATSELAVGTKDPKAKYHHNDGSGTMPQRRLWPKELPQLWLDRINTAVVSGISEIFLLLQGRGQI